MDGKIDEKSAEYSRGSKMHSSGQKRFPEKRRIGRELSVLGAI
jgi:hypothetical protein